LQPGGGFANAVAIDAEGNIVAGGNFLQPACPDVVSIYRFGIVKLDGANGSEKWRQFNELEAPTLRIRRMRSRWTRGNVLAAGLVTTGFLRLNMTGERCSGVADKVEVPIQLLR